MHLAILGLLTLPASVPLDLPTSDILPDDVAQELLEKLDGDVEEADLERAREALEWEWDHPGLL